MFNKDFYPTPDSLIRKMFNKLDRRRIANVLEPSAGKGNILDWLKKSDMRKYNLHCIELDNDLQSILKGKGYKVIDSDFLSYSGLQRFDTIIMNPPFSDGATHLLKAIDITYNGQIVCLLNAETLKNPYSNKRKMLVSRLEELDADVEYIENAFVDAERRTYVEVAIVYINIENSLDDLIFHGCEEKRIHQIKIDQKFEMMKSGTIEYYVEQYERDINSGLELIKSYFQYKGNFLSLDVCDSAYERRSIVPDTISHGNINSKINEFVTKVKEHYWKKILDMPDVKNRMTDSLIVEFNEKISHQSHMDFTENNIRQFIINLIGNYETILNRAVEEIFDLMSRKHHWHPETETNILHFNGWKTNSAHKVKKKVILPYGYDSEVFIGYRGEWQLNEWRGNIKLNDIDKVMNYFDDRKEYVSIIDAIKEAFKTGQSKKIESTYFTITCYKKGTMHLTFNDLDILRRFNIKACQNKKWLPHDYGKKHYEDMGHEEKAVVNDFEDVRTYQKNVNQVGYARKENVQLIDFK